MTTPYGESAMSVVGDLGLYPRFAISPEELKLQSETISHKAVWSAKPVLVKACCQCARGIDEVVIKLRQQFRLQEFPQRSLECTVDGGAMILGVEWAVHDCIKWGRHVDGPQLATLLLA